MSLPFEMANAVVTTTVPDEIVAMDFPGRADLTKLIAVSPDVTDAKINVYSRAFTSDAVAVFSITDDGNGKTAIELAAPLLVNVGDVLTVAGSDVVGYNVATHRVTSYSSDERRIVTDQTYSADGAGGTAALSIPTAERELYRVMLELTLADGLLVYIDDDGASFHNQDPRTRYRGQIPRLIYLQFSAAGTYRVTLGGRHSEAPG